MENRLFLLDPGSLVPSGLTDNILTGVDVTPEKEYSGKITLTQLNAYSGELKAEALTNFQTIKIEKDGSETYTNVAKLLLELQQGGGVEDAIEEAIIEIDSKKGDAILREELKALAVYVDYLHFTPESYKAGLEEGVITSVEEEKGTGWEPSIEIADGERTRFMARDKMSEASEQFLVVLNGVIVTPEDGNPIMSEFGPYWIGFEFNVAPSVGDIVEFNGTRTTGKAVFPYEVATEKNNNILESNKTTLGAFQDEMAVLKADINTEMSDIDAERSVIKARISEFEESRLGAYEAMLSSSSIAEVAAHADKVKSLDKELLDLYNENILLGGQWDRLNKSIQSVDFSVSEAIQIYKRVQKEGDVRQFIPRVDMFNAIRNEQNGGGAA